MAEDLDRPPGGGINGVAAGTSNPLPLLPVGMGPGSVAGRGRWRNFGLAAMALAAATLVLRLADSPTLPEVQNFILVTSSLLIEAFPFILLGALVGATIEYVIPASALGRFASLPRPLQLPLAALGGFAFPVCECGSVPVARRLVMKGFSPRLPSRSCLRRRS